MLGGVEGGRRCERGVNFTARKIDGDGGEFFIL
jgi:hypothetical protein